MATVKLLAIGIGCNFLVFFNCWPCGSFDSSWQWDSLKLLWPASHEGYFIKVVFIIKCNFILSLWSRGVIKYSKVEEREWSAQTPGVYQALTPILLFLIPVKIKYEWLPLIISRVNPSAAYCSSLVDLNNVGVKWKPYLTQFLLETGETLDKKWLKVFGALHMTKGVGVEMCDTSWKLTVEFTWERRSTNQPRKFLLEIQSFIITVLVDKS